VALRRALGAGRGRIFRQLMIEAAWLAALGGVAGLWIAWWGGRSLLALLSAGAADAGGLAVVLDGRVLTFTAVCALGAGLLFGLVPALRGARQPLAPVMQSEAGASRPRLRLASLLVVAQVGLSLVLLAGAGVLVLTLHNLQQSDPGFKAQGLITFGLHPSQLGYRRAALPGLYDKLAQRLAAIPGVEGVGYSTEPLLSPDLAAGFSERIFTRADGQKILPKELGIGPGYPATLGVPLQAGRYLLASDLDTAQGQPTPVLINQKFAQDWFVNASPIGQILRFNARDPGARIVGVVGNTLFESQREAPAPEIFVPGYGGAGYFTLRSRLPVSALLPAVRDAVAAVDRNLPLYNPHTQLQNQAQLLAQEKMLARLGGLFAGLALLLSAIGLYGLLAFEVVQRRRELGIRMVMGARPAHLLRGVALRTLGLTGAGLLLGLAGAWAALGMLSHWLYQVAPLSPRALVPAAVLLLAAAAAASVLPVRRALRSDPAEVLRAE
jgi:predicted permease